MLVSSARYSHGRRRPSSPRCRFHAYYLFFVQAIIVYYIAIMLLLLCTMHRIGGYGVWLGRYFIAHLEDYISVCRSVSAITSNAYHVQNEPSSYCTYLLYYRRRWCRETGSCPPVSSPRGVFPFELKVNQKCGRGGLVRVLPSPNLPRAVRITSYVSRARLLLRVAVRSGCWNSL